MSNFASSKSNVTSNLSKTNCKYWPKSKHYALQNGSSQLWVFICSELDGCALLVAQLSVLVQYHRKSFSHCIKARSVAVYKQLLVFSKRIDDHDDHYHRHRYTTKQQIRAAL